MFILYCTNIVNVDGNTRRCARGGGRPPARDGRQVPSAARRGRGACVPGTREGACATGESDIALTRICFMARVIDQPSHANRQQVTEPTAPNGSEPTAHNSDTFFTSTQPGHWAHGASGAATQSAGSKRAIATWSSPPNFMRTGSLSPPHPVAVARPCRSLNGARISDHPPRNPLCSTAVRTCEA